MTEPEDRKLPAGFTMAGLTFVLAALSWIGPFSIDTYLPSLPDISRNLGVSAAQVQQTMTAFLAFFAFMSLWHGAISDAYGRRRLTLICLSVFTVASLGCATAANVHILMFFRALQGATAGAGMVVGRAVVRDLFEGAAAQRLMSHVATIFTIAPVVAPVAGGYLQSWFGWRSIFYSAHLAIHFPSDRILALAARDSAEGGSARAESQISRALLLEGNDIAAIPAGLRVHGLHVCGILYLHHGCTAVPDETPASARDPVSLAVRPDGGGHDCRSVDFGILRRKDIGQ